MRRKWLIAGGTGTALALGLALWLIPTTGAQNPDNGNGKKAVEPLPIRQVVLFNSGVGYFQREGAVDGNAQVDLSFPALDVNDLLKSLVLQDLGGGKISSVSYDSHDPIEKILRSFALDLNGNPTFGQILNQARGEKVELLLRPDKKETPPAKVQGTIVGMELKRRPIGKDMVQVVDMETLNISGQSGLQSVNLEDIIGVRFVNPTLENEFQRALRVLASSHDVQKKSVTLGFTGAGKRAVRVGYVVERPIWKTSYRLRIEPNGKIFLQGWALVENTSDDDWNDVRMVLVSGKPISYRMNLYEPLYIPRPVVEPELFASLRPPVYGGAMGQVADDPAAAAAANVFGNPGGAPPVPPTQGGPAANPGFAQNIPFNPSNFAQPFLNPFGGGGYQGAPMAGYGGGFGGGFQGFGFQGFNQMGQGQFGFNSAINYYQNTMPNRNQELAMINNRLTFDELQRRRNLEQAARQEAKGKGPAIAGLNFKEGIASVATAEEVGDYYQYIIDQRISLSRQKSAMLPILDQTIEGSKVSIYNESIQAKYPLLGLKLKNTSGQPLTQGPITVYDSSTYSGDTRILDLQPGEERLLSYALDQSTEVKTDVKTSPSPEMNFRLGEPNLTARYKLRQTTTYTIKNRSTTDRTIILEHPIQSDWKLVGQKAGEKTRDHYRFTVQVAPGKTASHDVVEEQARVDSVALAGAPTPFYSIGIGVAVKPMVQVEPDKLVNLRISKGILIPTWKTRESRTYHVQNLSGEDRNFTIDHVIRKDWSRIDAKGGAQPGPGVVRFKLDVAKNKTGSQEVIEERVHSEKGTLLKLVTEEKLREFLAHTISGADVKAALTKTLALQARLAQTKKQVAEFDGNLKIVSDDQARLRENLKIVPLNSDPYKRFLDKFVNQETEIENLQKSLRQAQTALASLQREYDEFVLTLNAE
jgi:hypothetical protein